MQAHPVGLEGTREPAEVLERMELGLVGEAHRGGDRERQVGVLHQRGRQPGSARRLDLLLELLALVGQLAVDEIRLAPKVTVDAELQGQLEHTLDAALVCVAVQPRLLAAEAPFEPRVGEPVQRAELRGVVSACPGAHEARLEHYHAGPAARQLQSGAQAADARADHAHVGVDVLLERGTRYTVGGVEPE